MPSIELSIRQVVPLALLYESDGYRIEGRTRFQKLVFLTKEAVTREGIDLYDFIKYDYGPFSKELLDDLEWLEEKGLVEIKKRPTFGGNTRYDHELTGNGAAIFEGLKDSDDTVERVAEVAAEIENEYNGWSIRRLLDYIYSEFPEYQENSVYY